MKNLLVFAVSLILVSCCANNNSRQQLTAVPVGTIFPTDTLAPPTEAVNINTSTSETFSSREDIEYRPFFDEWTRIHNLQPGCIAFDDNNQIWSVFLEFKYFDGNSWNTIPTPEKFGEVWSCPHISKDGLIYFFYSARNSTVTSLPRFDGKNWAFFDLPDYLSESMLKQTSMAMDASGHIWLGLQNCGDNSCLYRFDGTQWNEVSFPFSSIRSLSADQKGNLWIGGNSNTGIAHYDGKAWMFYATETLWPDGYSYGWNADTASINVKIDFEGAVWAVLKGNDWVKINPAGKITWYPVELEIASDDSLTLYPDIHKRIWFILNWELGYFDYDKTEIVSFQGLKKNALLAGSGFYISPDGDWWLVLSNGTQDEAGIYQYTPTKE